MKLEATLAPGVVLVDVSREMPRARKPAPNIAAAGVQMRMPPLHRRRALSKIERVYVHHSGSEGRPGLDGAKRSAYHSVHRRDFHCAAYHYWIPAEPVVWRIDTLVDPGGDPGFGDALVILRLNRDSERCWHTGRKANTHGIGICLQGDLNKRDLTDFQKECLEALLPWLRERHPMLQEAGIETNAGWKELPVDWLSWHSDSGQYGGRPKKACPGAYTEAWLRKYVGA